ncbi:MAG: TonB-dependent receptor [Sandaracinus sp.]
MTSWGRNAASTWLGVVVISGAVVTGAAALGPSLARADGVADEADLHFQRGIDAYRDGAYLDALEHFLASNRLVPNHNVVYNIARTYEHLSRPADAYRYYEDALAGETDAETRARIEASLTSLASSLALVTVETTPAGASLYVDRRDLGTVGVAPRSLALTPGSHRIIAELPGHAVVTSEPFEARTGERVQLVLELPRIEGRVVVTTEGATVRVDREDSDPVCTSPCEVSLVPGIHILYLGREGYATEPRQVTVTASSTETIGAALTALTGSLLVTADETNARIEVDDRTVGFTPSVVQNLAVGSHHVRVSASGYVAAEADVVIEEGQQAELRDVHLVARHEVAAASRRSESLDDAPASVSVISSQEMEAFGYPTIYEALRGVRGFALTTDSTYSNAAVRGLGQPNDYSNRLLVLSDGAILNENILYQPFIGFDGRVDLGDVDRIEIVRGAGSVLYGSSAMSGVINLVPHARDEPTHVDFGISSFNTTGRARASLNLRLGTDTGLRLSLSGAHSEGRDVTMIFDADGDGVPDRNVAHGVDRFDAFSTSGRFFHEALTVQWFYTYRDNHIPTGSFATIFDRGDDDRYHDQRALLEVRFEPRLSNEVQLFTRAYVNYAYFHLDYLYGTTQTDPRSMRPYEQPYQETYHGLWTGVEARGVFEVVPQLRLTAGGEAVIHPLVTMNISQVDLDDATGAFSTTTVTNVSRPYQVYSGYALGDWEPVHEMHLNVGARFDYWDNPQYGDASDVPDFFTVNPRLALIFRLSPSDNLKVVGGRAFRAPSVYENYYTDGGATQLPSTCCGRTIQPETVYAGEIEVRHHFDDDWSALGSAHFQLAQQLVDSLPPPADLAAMYPNATYYGNTVGDVVLYGADVEVRRELRNGWMFDFQAGVLDARYLITPAGTTNDRVPNVPPVTGSIRMIAPIIERYVQAAVRVSAEGQRRISLASDDESSWAAIVDFVLSGAANEVGLRYSIGVYNLFDWQVALPVAPFPSRTMPQPGRTLMLSLTLTL